MWWNVARCIGAPHGALQTPADAFSRGHPTPAALPEPAGAMRSFSAYIKAIARATPARF